MVKILNRQETYAIELIENETIEIKINGNLVFNQTISEGKSARINFSSEEYEQGEPGI